jgi:hypothetical protein
MRKIITLLFIANVFVMNSSKAQTAPVAVNDTIWSAFDTQTSITRTFIVSNDTTKGGGLLKVDTIYYNGLGVVSNVVKNALGLSSFKYTPPIGFFGKDSITYYLTNYPTNYGYDTATIYIYVKRKAYENIDLNNVNARVDFLGLFNDKANSISAFEVPKGSGSHTIYASNFWFAGLDVNGQLKGYAETFANTFPTLDRGGNSGPIMDNQHYENYSYQWDRVWKVSAVDIQNHINGSGTTEAILNWPAHGDVSKGQAPNLAPFVDNNGDDYYNPMDGDYPLIKGQQAIYFIRNSNRSYTSAQIPSSGLEFHGMVYAYDCPEDSAINHTVFVDYTIYNRSSFTLTDCYFGQWVDLDIGNSSDDFIGCDVSRGAFYAYNGDANDEDVNGINGYGTFLPAQGVIFLKGAKQENDGNDNPLTTNVPTAIAQNGIPYAGLGTGFGDGTIDNEYVGLSHFMYYNIGTKVNGNGDPTSASDIYNYLRGRWTNGNILVWGGDGNVLGTGTGDSARYMFPKNSDPLRWGTNGATQSPSTWWEGSVGNLPGDRRGIGSAGSFTILSGESVEMELAFVFGRDYQTSGTTAGIVVMQERVDSIRSYHANGFETTPCGGLILNAKEEVKKNNTLSIYPNPFPSQFLINYKPSNSTVVEVYNLLGGKIISQQITQHLTMVDLSTQPQGIYFVRLTDGKEVITKKVVKQ